MLLPIAITLPEEDEKQMQERYEIAKNNLNMIEQFSLVMIIFMLIRITTLEIVILVCCSVTVIMIYLAIREMSLCLILLGFVFSLFWVFFFFSKSLHNFIYLIDPNFSMILFVWLMILDVTSFIVFGIYVYACLSAYFDILFVVFVEGRRVSAENEFLVKKNNEENDKNENFGAIDIKIEINK